MGVLIQGLHMGPQSIDDSSTKELSDVDEGWMDYGPGGVSYKDRMPLIAGCALPEYNTIFHEQAAPANSESVTQSWEYSLMQRSLLTILGNRP
jgi:hypothetical protein